MKVLISITSIISILEICGDPLELWMCLISDLVFTLMENCFTLNVCLHELKNWDGVANVVVCRSGTLKGDSVTRALPLRNGSMVLPEEALLAFTDRPFLFLPWRAQCSSPLKFETPRGWFWSESYQTIKITMFWSWIFLPLDL